MWINIYNDIIINVTPPDNHVWKTWSDVGVRGISDHFKG